MVTSKLGGNPLFSVAIMKYQLSGNCFIRTQEKRKPTLEALKFVVDIIYDALYGLQNGGDNNGVINGKLLGNMVGILHIL